MTLSSLVQFPRMPRGPRDQRRYTERPRQQGLVRRAMVDSVRKLDPRLAIANPVMFVVWCGTALCLLLTLLPNLLDAGSPAGERGFNALVSLTLLATLLFANFAEAAPRPAPRPCCSWRVAASGWWIPPICAAVMWCW